MPWPPPAISAFMAAERAASSTDVGAARSRSSERSTAAGWPDVAVKDCGSGRGGGMAIPPIPGIFEWSIPAMPCWPDRGALPVAGFIPGIFEWSMLAIAG